MTRSMLGVLIVLTCLIMAVFASVAVAANSMEAASRVGEPGQPDLPIPVNGEWEEALLAYTISIEFDPDFIAVTDVNLDGTVAADAEYFVPQWNNDTGYLTAEVVMGTEYPADLGNSIPAGSGCLLTIVVTVNGDAPYGSSTTVDLADGLGIPPRDNMFYWNDGTGVGPTLQDGTLRTIYVWACDFEAGSGGFTGNGEWEWGTDPWDSGNSLWGTNLGDLYQNDACYGLYAEFEVPAGYESAYLTFRHKYAMAMAKSGPSHADDGGNVQALIPPFPPTYTVLEPDWVAYDVDTLTNACLFGQPGYTDASPGWPNALVTASFDVSGYLSPKIGVGVRYYELRWMFGSDHYSQAQGWHIDDVRMAAAPTECGPFFIRGDVNNDGHIDITDVTYLSNYMYSGGPPPPLPCDRGDVNDDGTLNVIDMTWLIDFIYSGGDPPVWPYPLPGIDSTPDDLPTDCGGGGKAMSLNERQVSLSQERHVSLPQNVPNPFSSVTEIRYDLPTPGHVTLEVYNSLGQKVATVVDADQQAGTKTVSWDASPLPSGIYFYKLNAGGRIETQKMILLK